MSASKVLGIFCLALILLLTATGTGFAQDGQPPKPPDVPLTPPIPPGRLPFDGDQIGKGSPTFAQAASDVSAQALTLGAPGLSYRYVQSFGTVETPYFSDTTHLNRPEGLFMDTSNNLYVAEQQGARILKYNSGGTNTLAIGKAGVTYTDDYVFNNPADMAVDSGGNIWVVDYSRVVQYDSSGTILQSLPAQDDNPWQTGNTNDRFDNARGIAFGSDGRMYVSDSNNHRVQVYTMGTGSPVYDTTIGTGSAGSGSTEFSSPYRIAVHGSSHLYVVDNGNNRVQHCTKSGTWSCATLVSGLDYPQGITVDSSNNNVYVADTNNDRILKCPGGTSCSTFVSSTHWSWTYDVAVDSSGNVYSAESWSGTVVKYNSSGNFVSTYVGVNGTPYLTDNYHYNHPRVAIDGSNNIIILEENGQRLIKLNAGGVYQWSVGVPGVDNPTDNTHLNWPHGVAVDTSGNIYVADNNRVQIFNGNGIYLNTIGGSWGSGNYEFGWAAGIAVDNNGTIYVSDCQNNRVQVYNSSRTYVATLGVTSVSGSDNGHLNCPIGVGVDSARNIYVADAGNKRVQKFNSSRVWQMTLGTPGPWGSGSEDFAYFGSGPEDIAVDALGRIYVADINNNRVQVFDSSGAYLTTIGGNWGSNTSQFRGTSGVDVDSQGNVYVSDFGNARIQKFAPGVPGWQQKNINGFGDRFNRGISSLEVFSGTLYAGASNWDQGGTIWRSTDAQTWTQVSEPGFGVAYGITNPGILDMVEFDGQLYASTGWDDATGQLWRSTNGTTWEQVVSDGFGDADNNAISAMAVYNGMIYVGTGKYSSGPQIWRSSSGDNSSWDNVVNNGLGCGNCSNVTGLIVFNSSLYASVEDHTDPHAGMQIWHTNNGSDWSQVGTTGFGSAENYETGGFAVFNGNLYIGTRNDVTGGQLWRSSDGSTWTQVVGNGFGDLDNNKVESLYTFGGNLYAGTDNSVTGIEIWRSADGTTWSQINPDGFGDSNNESAIWSSATTVFNGNLFFGTLNWNGNGGEIWSWTPPVEAYIGGTLRGSYYLTPGQSTRQNYAGVDSGPVKVESTNGVPIISAIRDAWAVNGVTTSFSQLMGLPLSQVSDKYVFPGYNNVTLNEQLRIANVDTVQTTVTVTIGGVLQGTYTLYPPGSLLGPSAVRANYPGLDSGPVIVEGTAGVDIISAIRDAWAVNGVTKSFIQFMGLPAGQLSNKYVFPAYNNVTLNEQLRIANVDTVPSTVTVTIGGVLQGTYTLYPPGSLLGPSAVRVNYPGLDSGPVVVEGTVGVDIISSIRDAWAVNGVTTSFSQLMGVPAEQLSNKYVFPAYNNVTLNDQLRIANVDTVQTTVTVRIGGVLQGTYTLYPPGSLLGPSAVRINYAGLDSGPVVVEGTAGVEIISAIREAWAVNGVTQSFVQLMGLPAGQLSTTYLFPAYNNVTLNEQLRIGMP